MTTQNVTAEKPQTALSEDVLHNDINGLTLVEVKDAASFEQASRVMKLIVDVEKKVKDYWGPIKDSAHKTWKGLVAKESEMLDPLAAAKDKQRLSAKTWADEEERKRKAEEARLQEIARKQAEDAALAAAAEAEASGDTATAEQIIQAPVEVPQVTAPRSVPSGHGRLLTKYYSAELVGVTEDAKLASLKLLVTAIAAGKVPLHAVQLNNSFANGQAKQFKTTAALNWPGVQVNVR